MTTRKSAAGMKKERIMELKTVEDVLLFAVQKEGASVQFYLDLAEQMEDPAAKIIFELLSRKEMEHKASLELEMMKLGKIVTEQIYNLSEDEEPYPYIELDNEARSMGFSDALRLAVRKERASFILFTELVAQTSDPELRGSFLELAEEEMRHMIQLEDEYNRLMPGQK